MLDLSKEMGAELFSGIPYGLWNTRPGADDDAIAMKKERRANAIRGLKEVAKHAEEVGVVICLEIVNRFEQYIANTAEEGIAICEEINNPYCKLLLDTFHMNIEEPDCAESIRKAGKRIGHVHVADSDRWYPGHAHYDFASTFSALKEVGYERAVALESFLYPDPETA